MQVHLLSDVGKRRKNNEDSCLFCAPQENDCRYTHGMLCAVADGMGGASAGEYASRMALQVLAKTYFDNPADNIPTALHRALETANLQVFEEAEINPIYSGMGTTVSALVIHGDWAYIVQVGDSRVYLLRERSGIHQLTEDHSLVAEQVRNGLISEAEARTHSLKNLITRAVGIKESVKIDSFAVQLRRGDTLLLCSDGLSNLVTDEEIAQLLSHGDLNIGTRQLIEHALDGGGTDNITALTVRITETLRSTQQQQGAKEVNISASGFFQKLRSLFS